MDSLAASGRRAPRNYLLTGLLRCGKCGNRLYSAARQTTRRYVCSSGPDHGGCGRLTVVAEPVERLIADAVLIRLSSPDLAAALAGRATDDERAAAVSEQLVADKAQLEELSALYGARQITAAEWMAAREPIQARIADAERHLTRASNTAALDGLIGAGDALRAQWGSLNLDRQSAVVRALVEHVVIAPGTPGARTLDIERVQPVWRL
jgi:hypothetical protein